MNNEIEKGKTRAKRKLKALDFTSSDAAIALVSDSQGGPANGHDYALVIKSTANFSDEFLEKMSKVRVEMDIVEYLTRFFGVYGADAEVLARSLGYTTPGMDKAALEQQEEMLEDQKPPEYPSWEDEPGDKKFERYVESKVASIEVMKQLYESENMTDILANLSEEQYLQFLVDQQNIEKAFKKMDAEQENKSKAKPKVKTKVVEVDKKTESVEKSAEDVTSVASEVISEDKPSVVTKHKEKKSMTQETVHVTEKEVELVEKSQFDDIQKAFNETQVELKKALEEIEKYRIEKATAIAKARKEQITKACGKHAEVIFKAVGECEEETFVAVVKALAEMNELIEKSALFQEQGASVSDGEKIEEDALIKMMKSKYKQQ